jgi:hypothetical protein
MISNFIAYHLFNELKRNTVTDIDIKNKTILTINTCYYNRWIIDIYNHF